MESLSISLLAWYDKNKRILPWRDIKDPYRIWVSEVMLQQTQVATVIPFYERFMEHFPVINNLAESSMDEVLKLWEGLGYYSRARNLKKGAEQIISLYNGFLPTDEKQLLKISGIGPYTAGAILSIAYDLPYPAVDGNVIRVLSRIFGIRDDVTHKETLKLIRAQAKRLCSYARPGDFNQAVMDLGATLCVPGTPDCNRCPIACFCDAYQNGDASDLPIKTQTRPPKNMQVGVALVTHNNRILVMKRKKRMLGGLYVFILDEFLSERYDMEKLLNHMGISCTFKTDLGVARHVFTHRVWNMHLYHFSANKPIDIENAQWITKDELSKLPFPTAMKVALEKAFEIIM